MKPIESLIYEFTKRLGVEPITTELENIHNMIEKKFNIDSDIF